MQLLIDTDFIIKMGRYRMLEDFEALVVANGHPKPFFDLYEIRAKIQSGRQSPQHSEFRTHAVVESCWSFSAGCTTCPKATDADLLDEILAIDGVDPGEALLLANAVNDPNSLVVTGDKTMVRGLMAPIADSIRARMKERILLIDRVIWSLKPNLGIPEIRKRVHAVPDCDVAIFDAMHPSQNDSDAEARFFKMIRDFENTSRGLLKKNVH